MSKPNIRLLTKLLDVVKKAKPSHFTMDCFIEAKDSHRPACGTIGCMVGHGVLAGLFKGVHAKLKADVGDSDTDQYAYVEWFLNRKSIGFELEPALNSIQDQLGLNNQEFEYLFYNTCLTKREATAQLKDFILDNS